MKLRSLQFAMIILALVLASLACSFNLSTAKIAGATLSAEESGSPASASFTPQQSVIYLIVELANAPDDTSVKAVWTAVEAEGVEPNFLIDQNELASGSGTLTFSLSNEQLWPVGSYKVDLYLNGTLDRTLEFEVQ